MSLPARKALPHGRARVEDSPCHSPDDEATGTAPSAPSLLPGPGRASLTKPRTMPISPHMNEMTIQLLNYTYGTGVLGGATAGRLHLDALSETVRSEPAEPRIVVLDFAGVDVATASWIREAVLGFRDRLRGRRSNWYPVVHDLSEDVMEEFLILLKQRAEVVLAFGADGKRERGKASPLGVLDDKQRMTFEMVNERIETDAGELMRAYGEREGTRHQTAWNNRLAGLAASGLVAEISRGRSKRYRTLLQAAAPRGAN